MFWRSLKTGHRRMGSHISWRRRSRSHLCALKLGNITITIGLSRGYMGYMRARFRRRDAASTFWRGDLTKAFLIFVFFHSV